MSRIAAVRIASVCSAIIVIIGFFYLSLMYASPFARSWDEVDFVLALERYDLLAMQPHFPGYPYFIAGASIIHRWVADPVLALVMFNAVAAFSSAIPITLLARRYVKGSTSLSLWLTSLVLTTPYLWLMAARPMSECAGIAVLWWFLWSVRHAMEHPKSGARHALVLVLFGFLMGTRLSFFPFGVAILLLWAEQYKINKDQEGKRLRLALSIMAAGLIQLIWIVGLALSEGTISGFWKLSIAFVKGHFSEWGGGIVSTQIPFGQRIAQLFGSNLIGDVLLSRSAVIGALLLLLLTAVYAGQWLLRRTETYHGKGGFQESEHHNRRYTAWLITCIGFYLVWALFGQNIEKPRHISPVAGPLLLLFYAATIRTVFSLWSIRQRYRKGHAALSAAIIIVLSGLLITQIVYGADLLRKQAEELPSVYQLHDYVRGLETPVVLYTWEETRVLQYLQADYENRRILTFDYFNAIVAANSGKRVLLTDHVLHGFEQQDPSVRSQVAPIAEFKSNALFDPVYANIILYEWKQKP
ncbi:hypothetical protein [Cohnella sp.]|uniref:hypothetical protein n=1 Tax=Cohnella sp. TaxID=1883426 RepID=UPI003561F9D1